MQALLHRRDDFVSHFVSLTIENMDEFLGPYMEVFLQEKSRSSYDRINNSLKVTQAWKHAGT